ncbi:MAG TPA: adenosine deaminase [Gemmatimonadales bacterium]
MPSNPDRDLLRRLPKAELHCHLDGSLRPATLLELGRALGRPMPAETPEALAEYMRVDDARHLEDYLERFDITLSVMQDAHALDRIAYELVADAAADGVRYIEVRFAPVLNTREGLTMPDVLDAALAGMARAEREHGTVARVIVCALRNMTAALSKQAAELAVAYRHRGVVAFDLAGGEAGNPPSVHAEAFHYARTHDLACTCHAGEGAGAESVRQAIHLCGAHRVGHGTRLFEDPSLEQYVNDRRIPIEICLTSNVQTRAVSDFASHPLRRYHDEGLAVVLNTDNRMMSGVTLTDEYAAAAEHLGFSFDELAELAVRSFEYGFLPWRERLDLMERARATVDALREEVSA